MARIFAAGAFEQCARNDAYSAVFQRNDVRRMTIRFERFKSDCVTRQIQSGDLFATARVGHGGL